MAVIIECRSCHRRLRVGEDQLGRKVRCPGCKDAFVAEEVADADAFSNQPAPRPGSGSGRYPARRDEEYEDDSRRFRRDEEDEEDDYDDRRQRKQATTSAWKKVRLGFSLYVASLLTGTAGLFLVGALSVLIVGSLASMRASGQGMAAGALLCVFLMGATYLVCWGLFIGGHCLFFFVPDKPGTGLRALGIATGILGIAMIACQLLGTLANVAESGLSVLAAGPRGMASGGMVGAGFQMLSVLALLGHIPVGIFFMRSVALAMKRKELARHLVLWLIWLGILIGVCFVLLILLCGGASVLSSASSASAGSGTMGSAAGAGAGAFTTMFFLGCATWVLTILASLALSIWYIILVFQVRGAIDSRLRR